MHNHSSEIATRIAAKIRIIEKMNEMQRASMQDRLKELHDLLSLALRTAIENGIECKIDEDRVVALGGTDKPDPE